MSNELALLNVQVVVALESNQPIHRQQFTTLYNIANVMRQLLELANASKLSQVVPGDR